MKHGIRWIYDADISGFFDNIDRGWLRNFIQQRINDGGLLRLIGKWLNAGVMEGDQITYSDRGTPQGGVISPCLANVFLARRGWKFWLNRRSSKKALNWEKFEALLESMPLPTPKIIHYV